MAIPQVVIRQWSTREVPEAQRMDYYTEVLSSAIDPMGVAKRLREPFNADIESVDLGPITAIHGAGGAHDCVRGQRDLDRSTGRNFHLIVNLASGWNIEHLGSRHVCQGDAILVDSRYRHAYRFVSPFDNVHLRLPEAWLTSWVAHPDVLVGRPILSGSNWGSALTAFVSQLSPQFVANAPLPHALIADHIGALLALFANEVSAGAAIAPPVQRALADCIHEIIVQRCTEPALCAHDVAAALNVSTRTLHRGLARCQQTFAGLLIEARVSLATRMLESPLFHRLTTAEIGRRAGFTDASHFARSYRRASGFTPAQVQGRRHPRPAGDLR